jgi:hypothetical protein
MAPRPWTGSWTGASDNSSAVSAISAMTRGIGAASALGARGRTSHNPPVVGSSPTRPTYSYLRKRSEYLVWQGRRSRTRGQMVRWGIPAAALTIMAESLSERGPGPADRSPTLTTLAGRRTSWAAYPRLVTL